MLLWGCSAPASVPHTRGPQPCASLTLLLRHFFAADQVPVGGSEDQELPSALGALEFLQRAGRIHQPSRGHLDLTGIFCMRGRIRLQNTPACECSPIQSSFCIQACNQNCISELRGRGTREIFCNLTLKPPLYTVQRCSPRREQKQNAPLFCPPLFAHWQMGLKRGVLLFAGRSGDLHNAQCWLISNYGFSPPKRMP